MSKFSLGAILTLVSLVPNIQAGDKPVPDSTFIRAEIRIISIRDDLVGSEPLSEKELNALQTAPRDKTKTNILTAPTITVQSGQTGTVEYGQIEHFVTDLKTITVNEQKICAPIQTPYFLGSHVNVKATDLKVNNSVSVEVQADYTQLDGPVLLVPITNLIPPIEGGAKGAAVPFTQYLQKPKIQKIAIQGSLTLPSGGTGLLMSHSFVVETRQQFGNPMLSELPYLGRLFSNVGYGRESRRLLILVTPKLVRQNEQMTPTMGEAVGALIDAPCKKPQDNPRPVQGYVTLPEAMKLCLGSGRPDTGKPDAVPANTFYKPMPTGGLAGGIVFSTSSPPVPICAPYPAKLYSPESMNLADIAALTVSGVSDEIILNQIRTVGATFTLGTEQIIWLKTQKVSDAVIVAMQNTRTVPACPTPLPMKILPPAPMPETLNKLMQPYRIEAPDILSIDVEWELLIHPVPLCPQPIAGQHLVRPDGTVGLGTWGSVPVAGLTLDEAADAVRRHVFERIKSNPKLRQPYVEALKDADKLRVAVNIFTANSKKYYLITDLTGSGEQVYCFPITGNDTVLQALSNIKELPAVASKSDIWVTRKTSKEEQLLMVDYVGITRDGVTTTNYQVLPGDRIYVNSPKKLGVKGSCSQPGDAASPVPPAFAQTRLTEEDGREIGKVVSELVGAFINEVAGLLQAQMTDESTSQRGDQSRLERDPNYRMRQMLWESENLRNPQDEKQRFWMNQQPSALSYDRLNGAIGGPK